MYKGIVFMQIHSSIYGLPQAGILSNKLLTKHLSKHGYYQTPDTPSLWTHSDYPVLFSLLVNNFAVLSIKKITSSRCPLWALRSFSWLRMQPILWNHSWLGIWEPNHQPFHAWSCRSHLAHVLTCETKTPSECTILCCFRMHHIVLLDLNMRKSNTQMLPMKYHACCPMKPNEFKVLLVTEITQPCVHTCNGLFICQLYSLPNLLEETDCKEDMPLMLPFCIIHFLLTVDNSDMN